MDAPDDNRMIVFSKGTWKAEMVMMFFGGHVIPKSMLGDSDLWKKAQKNDEKNSTSDAINRIIPQRKLFITI